ncbi:MAG: hypothetical protein H3C35_08075 [Bacteroidetes bacterium]|nr:hypothetical protein [Bacteroidota bacterium]
MKHFLTNSIISLFFFSVSLFSQPSQSRYITVVPTITDADIINAASLVDPLAEKIKPFSPNTFSLRIINTANAPVYASISLKAWVTLEEDRQREPIVYDAHTKHPFLIPVQGKLFTSADVQDGGADDISWSSSVNEELKTKLKNKITDPLSGGRVPSGIYEIEMLFRVDSVNGQYIGETFSVPIRPITVTNPSTAILDIPFENGYEYPTPFPQFQWTYDTRAVELSVFELRPEHASLEDAISGTTPYLRVRIDRKLSGNLRTYTYPQSPASRPGIEILAGPRQLERGKVYVVVLDGIRTAFGFTVEPLRTIRSFVVADPQGKVVMNVLENILSSGQYNNIISTLQNQNIIINTNSIFLNGIKISTQDLQKVLTDNKDRIVSVRTED